MSELKTKRERIQFLLEHYPDFYETMEQSSMAAGDGDGVALMPAMSRHPSVVELAHAIAAARLSAPPVVAHMMAFYTAEWRCTDQTVKRRTKKGRVELVKVRVRQRVLPRWINGALVASGVDAVTEAFRGEVFIPSELLEAAA